MFKKSEKFFDIIGEILAVVLVLVYVVLILNANFSFIPEGVFLNILEILRTYGSLILVGVVGLEAMSKRNLVFQIIFIALLALIVVFLFFPGTYENVDNFDLDEEFSFIRLPKESDYTFDLHSS